MFGQYCKFVIMHFGFSFFLPTVTIVNLKIDISNVTFKLHMSRRMQYSYTNIIFKEKYIPQVGAKIISNLLYSFVVFFNRKCLKNLHIVVVFSGRTVFKKKSAFTLHFYFQLSIFTFLILPSNVNFFLLKFQMFTFHF